jgi:O-antigen ligase
MTRPPAPDSTPAVDALGGLGRVLSAGGLAGLAIVTLASPGATRMYAWPWSLACHFTLAVPAGLLLLRLFNARHPLVLPDRRWFAFGIGGMAVVLASAGLSPYSGPSLLWTAPLLSMFVVFFVVFDWLHTVPGDLEARRARLLTFAGIFLAVIAIASMGLWALNLPSLPSAREVFDARNPFPLGHSNYTAGLALLMLPCFGALAWRSRGVGRAGWLGAGFLALAMLFTSGSRGGLLGLAALVLAFTPTLARMLRLKLWLVLLAGAVILGALLCLNPRLRAMAGAEPAGAESNSSNVERIAMLDAGLAMGADRPLLGWGPGATPLAFPRYRARLAGGAEDVLQLHSTPVQLWAEFGTVGIVGALALLGLALHASWDSLAARAALPAFSGYAVFSLFDWQLDVPVFAFALAAGTAWLAPAALRTLSWQRTALGAATLGAAVIMGGFGRPDPAPELNLRALELAHNPAQTGRTIALLQESLLLNPDQEIAHFNLGWLLVVSDPPSAEKHFLAAARLVPDKGGVYFGLGLARLNQGLPEGAAHAFALECINDPIFLSSPWWRQPALAAVRPATWAWTLQLIGKIEAEPSLRGTFAAREATYLAALVPWLDGTGKPGEILARADTAERADYLARHPAPPDFAAATVIAYRRERTGYPVLMRNLDLPAPIDLFDVQENSLAAKELRFLFPGKGWLPSPLLLALLAEADSRKN